MKTKKIFFLIILIMQIMVQTFAQNITADTTLANNYFAKAKVFKDSTQYDSAIVYFEKASQLYQNNNLWLKYLQSETQHGYCYQKQWQLNQAIAIIKPAIENTLLHTNENDTIVADAYNIVGLQYYYQSKNDSTLFYWKKTLEIRKNIFGEKRTDVARSYNNIGIVYINKSEYDKALEYFSKSLEIYLELLEENHTYVASAYNNIGCAYSNKLEHDKTLEYYFKCLEIKLELFGEKHNDVAMSYNNIGNVYWKKSEYDKALEYHLKSLEIFLELLGEKHTYVASSYGNIGNVYHNKCKYDNVQPVKRDSLLNRALEYHFKCLEIQLELLGEKHTDVAASYMNIGNVYADKPEYDNAQSVKRDSLLNKALDYYLKSLEIYVGLLGEKHTYVAMSYKKIGIIYSEKAAHEKVRPVKCDSLFNRALEYYQKGVASCLWNFNDTINVSAVPVIKDYLEWNELLKILQAKAQIFANNSPFEGGKGDVNQDTLTTTPQSQSKMEFLQLALRHYQACDTLISQVRQQITTKSDKLALGERASEIYKEAVNVCLSLVETRRGVSLLTKYNEQAFYFSERNKSSVLLEALAGSEALQFAGIPDILLQTEHKLSIDIANYINLKNNAENDSLRNVWSNRLFKANRSYDSLITVFETNYPDYYNLKYNNSPATVEQVANLLDEKTAMLSYFLGDSTITIFAISKKDFVVVETRLGVSLLGVSLLGVSLHEKIHDYRFYISDTDLLQTENKNNTHKSVDLYQDLAFQFYNLLFPPEIQEFLKGGLFYENLIIIPDGQLATIPFETLHTQKYTGEWTDWKSKTYFAEMPYLIKDYNISYNYSATLFQQTKPKQKTDKIDITPLNDWIAFAPVFDDQNTAGTTTRTRELLTFNNDTTKTRRFLADGRYVSPLPSSKKEIETIFNLYKQQGKKALIKTHLQANENFVKSDELQNYRIIHFATHGFVNEENPKLSGILFAQDTTANLTGFENLSGLKSQNEGILYQSEIYNLNFNADLVVLSACETGLGK
ncbi:MAG: CHAT domain-containing tetratricopeptide repeat protein, partial [Bacteroidota bacterium]|nr:CHAT domain-containing tetratricopeptide repeat protein [Bacteroidota bacterium]